MGGPHPYVDPAPEKVGGQLTPWTPWLRGPWLQLMTPATAQMTVANDSLMIDRHRVSSLITRPAYHHHHHYHHQMFIISCQTATKYDNDGSPKLTRTDILLVLILLSGCWNCWLLCMLIKITAQNTPECTILFFIRKNFWEGIAPPYTPPQCPTQFLLMVVDWFSVACFLLIRSAPLIKHRLVTDRHQTLAYAALCLYVAYASRGKTNSAQNAPECTVLLQTVKTLYGEGHSSSEVDVVLLPAAATEPCSSIPSRSTIRHGGDTFEAVHGLAISTINLSAKFEVFISTHYEGTKNDTK